MNQIIDRLFIGTECERPEGFACVCACRTPCYSTELKARTGLATVPPMHRMAHDIEWFEKPWLLLNLVDSPVSSVYQRKPFERFLEFASETWKDGKPLFIHSPDDSRAKSLALLFMAKALGVLPDVSFDAAWDEFENRGQTYAPSNGLQDWLREHWAELKTPRLAHIEGASAASPVDADVAAKQAEVVAPVQADELTPKQAIELAKMSPLIHFAGFARIVDKDNKLTPETVHIMPSPGQVKFCMAYEWCIANDVPTRLVVVKGRQSHMSTISAEVCYHHTRRYHMSGLMICDRNKRTDLIWEMFNGLAKTDRFAHYWDSRHTNNSEKATFTYFEGRKMRKMDWLRDTASDPSVGSSGTRQVIWFSEAGRYSKEGTVTDQQVVTNAMSSVPMKPRTLVIMESTAEGETGIFFSTAKGAVTLKEREAGKQGNGWILIFVAWHEVPEYRTKRSPNTEERFTAPLDADERHGVELYGWTAEQIAWRRQKLDEFDGNLSLFRQEYPSNVDEAFQSSGTPRFAQEGLHRLESMALLGHDSAPIGSIQENNGRLQFLVTPDDPWLWLKEPPTPGAKYLVFGDFMTAEQSEGSLNRDGHAAGVWRAAYSDSRGTPHGPKLVAALHEERGVRWDGDIIAKRVHLLSKFYGNAAIAMEVNEALGILALLKQAGANLWTRQKDDQTVPGQTLNIPGWKTTTSTRPILVDKMAEFVRNQEGEIHYRPAVAQLKLFRRMADGSCAAPPREHDDWVLAMGIGLACIQSATEFPVEPAHEHRYDTDRFLPQASARFGSTGFG